MWCVSQSEVSEALPATAPARAQLFPPGEGEGEIMKVTTVQINRKLPLGRAVVPDGQGPPCFSAGEPTGHFVDLESLNLRV